MTDLEIKELRKKLGISQEKLGELLGVHLRTVQNYENGGIIPKAKNIILRNLMEKASYLSSETKTLSEPMATYYKTKQENAEHIPLLPISAQAGTLNDFMASIKNGDCERIISPIKGADLALMIAGDSMAPEYPSGSQILVKKINEKAFIDWGKVYVLDTCNGAVVKKILPPDDKSESKVKCVSINPEYPPFEVNFSNINGVYRVLLCMSIK